MEFGFGSGILTGVRNDANASLPQTPQRFGALQGVDLEFAGDIKELFATQQFPIDVARGKTKINGKAKVAEIKGGMYNALFFGQTLGTGGLKYAYNESTTLGAATTGTSYTVANSGSTPLVDQGVFYASNLIQFTAVTGAPTLAQYTWNPTTGIYGFSTFDNSTPVLVNYTYHVTTGFNIAIGNPFMGTTPQFQMTLFQPYEGSQIVLVLNKCVSARLTFPTSVDDYVMQDLDFSAFADSANNVGTWSTST